MNTVLEMLDSLAPSEATERARGEKALAAWRWALWALMALGIGGVIGIVVGLRPWEW